MAKIEINWKILDALLQRGISRADCANALEVSPETLLRRIKEHKGMTFEEYAEKQLGNTRIKLTELALHKAIHMNSEKMLALCLKHFAKWGAKQEIEVSGTLDSNHTPPTAKEILELIYAAKKDKGAK